MLGELLDDLERIADTVEADDICETTLDKLNGLVRDVKEFVVEIAQIIYWVADKFDPESIEDFYQRREAREIFDLANQISLEI